MLFRSAILTESLTVAVHARKKPFIYAGFDNLNTDGHGWTQIFLRSAPAVAQNCILQYRGFAIRRTPAHADGSPLAKLCRIQFGVTADYKSALQHPCGWDDRTPF